MKNFFGDCIVGVLKLFFIYISTKVDSDRYFLNDSFIDH